MLRTWEQVRPAPDGPAILSSVTADEAARLAMLAAGRDVLEIGSANGYSAVVMALAGALVTAVDDHNGQTWLGDTYGTMTGNAAAYNVAARILIRRGRSEDVLPALYDDRFRYDLVFVDGDHGFHSVKHDVTWARQLLRPGGVLTCHDYGEDNCPGVAQALDVLYPEGPDQVTGTLWEKVTG